MPAKDTLAQLAESGAQTIATPDLAPNTAVTDIGIAQRLLGREGQIDRLILSPDQPLSRQPLAQVAPALTLTQPQAESDMAKLTDSFHLNLTAFGLLSFAVGLFIVHGAIGLAFEQRRAMLRSLRALGAPLRRLIVLMAVELASLALIGGSIGVALGLVIAAASAARCGGDAARALRRRCLGTAVVAADLVAFRSGDCLWWAPSLAGGGALWSLARMPLLATAQPQAWAQAQRGPLVAAAAFALLTLAAAIALLGSGLAGRICDAGGLVDRRARWPCRPCWRGVIGWGEALARGPVAQWFWADSRQQLPGLSLALMALLLAMAANVGVSTMVSSFRLTFIGFLDQRLASELYVTAQDATQAQAIQALEGEGRVDAVLPILSTSQAVAGAACTDLRRARSCHLPRQLAAFARHARCLAGLGARRGRADQRTALPPRGP